MASAPQSPTARDRTEGAKQLVRRMIDEVMNAGRLDVLDELYAPEMATAARRWIEPFRAAFPDVHMDIVLLVAEDDVVAGRFRCSGTQLGPWDGQPATGRRFTNVDEVYFFTIADGRIAAAWGLEDNDRRRRQLGM